MTAFCDWVGLTCFLVALVLSLVTPAPARLNWIPFFLFGVLIWAFPLALTAAHVAHS
jgi:hypothetical protein